MKIASIVGARPQFIKEYAVSKELKKVFDCILIHTGQHYDFEMSQVFFDQLKISEPDYNLGVGSGPQGKQTGEMLGKIEEVLLKEKPDGVLVYGDTNSTLAGALAATKMRIPLGHVEAGLRSFDKTMPEETNRVLTDHASDFLFAPTKTAVNNLEYEGIKNGVYLTGDVMSDTLSQIIPLTKRTDILKKLKIESKQYLLTTIHRQSNTDDPNNLSALLDSLSETKETIVFPVHPRTEKFIKTHQLENNIGKNIVLTKPLGYFEFLCLEQNAKKILTDSGGIQKEAYLLKIPCITLRENTEWVETVEDGWNVLVGTNKEKILHAVHHFEPKGKQRNIFGDGHASKTIVSLLKQGLMH